MNNFSELHLHIEGTLEPEFWLELALRNEVSLPSTELAELKKLYSFSDLQDFLNLYYQGMSALKTSADFEELANRYLARVSGTGLKRVEMFFDPQTHAQNGNDLQRVADGLVAACKSAPAKFGVEARMIMCFERDRGSEKAEQTLDELLELRETNPEAKDFIIGVGMDSAEAPFPPAPFKSVYARARDSGLHLTAHAGEEGSSEFVWSALDDLGAERIDHGVRSLEDKALIRRLVADKIPLTVCPMSNYALKVKNSLQEAADMARNLLEEGVKVTINSDDPAYFGGYIDNNFQALRDCGWTDDMIAEVQKNSIDACWG